jgi:hypothetical protein
MTNPSILKIKEKIDEIKEYLNSGCCQSCFDMLKILEEYSDTIKSIEESQEKK